MIDNIHSNSTALFYNNLAQNFMILCAECIGRNMQTFQQRARSKLESKAAVTGVSVFLVLYAYTCLFYAQLSDYWFNHFLH